MRIYNLIYSVFSLLRRFATPESHRLVDVVLTSYAVFFFLFLCLCEGETVLMNLGVCDCSFAKNSFFYSRKLFAQKIVLSAKCKLVSVTQKTTREGQLTTSSSLPSTKLKALSFVSLLRDSSENPEMRQIIIIIIILTIHS